CSVCRSTRRRVAGRCTQHGARPFLQRARDGHHHPAVLERSRWIQTLVLEEQLARANPLCETGRTDQRSAALVERDTRRAIGERQLLCIALQDSRCTQCVRRRDVLQRIRVHVHPRRSSRSVPTARGCTPCMSGASANATAPEPVPPNACSIARSTRASEPASQAAISPEPLPEIVAPQAPASRAASRTAPAPGI